MQRFRRLLRLIGDLTRTFAAIFVYLGVTGAIALASLHVIATTAELKCEVCADPTLLLETVSRRDAAPPAIPDTPLRGSLSGE